MIVTPPNNPSSLSAASSSGRSSNVRRGAFIVFEGVDRCGKTTQVSLIVKHLLKTLSVGAAAAASGAAGSAAAAAGAAASAAIAMRFPDRTTTIGKMIDTYLKDSTTTLDDHAIHLLFSANRWEVVPTLQKHLAEGTTVICDRYAYSGVAFSSAKVVGKDTQQPVMSMEWCQNPDVGLPAPDAVIFLDLSQEEAEKRGGYGGERYETRDMQKRVRERFTQLHQRDVQDYGGVVPWHFVNAARSVDDVHTDIKQIVETTIQNVQQGGGEGGENNDSGSKPLQLLWQKRDDKENVLN